MKKYINQYTNNKCDEILKFTHNTAIQINHTGNFGDSISTLLAIINNENIQLEHVKFNIGVTIKCNECRKIINIKNEQSIIYTLYIYETTKDIVRKNENKDIDIFCPICNDKKRGQKNEIIIPIIPITRLINPFVSIINFLVGMDHSHNYFVP